MHRLVKDEEFSLSSIKEHLFDVQSQREEEWIRERLEDENATEDSEEWISLSQQYNDYQEFLSEEAEHEAEIKWLKENGSSQIHQFFINEIEALEKITKDRLENGKKLLYVFNSQMIIKMAFSYSVTLFEAFLGDTLKSLINEDDRFLKNAIYNVENLIKAKYSLSDLNNTVLDVRSLAIRKISGILFHNIPKVKVIYEQVLGKKLDIDISKVTKITEIRHHIVHRNGSDLDGKNIIISVDELSGAIDSIKEFASNLQIQINNELNA